MRFITYHSESGPRTAVAKAEGGYVDLASFDGQLPTSLTELLAKSDTLFPLAAQAAAEGQPLAGEVTFLPPIPRPGKIICIGLNYRDHALETGKEPPSEPVVFSKFASSANAHRQKIVLPRVSEKVDYEAELVVVLGRGGRHIARDAALSHVAGYTCGHDVSARDWQAQKPGGQWLLGKTFDTFATFGPELVTADEVGDPGQLDIALRLNGTMMQQSNTRQLIFPVDELISYVSAVCTLEVGDVIFTGTPPGVGVARKPPVYLKPGDVAEVEIEKIGLLQNPVVAEES